MKGKNTLIGLALGGGGARGFAHIGVLRVLEEENVPIDMIVGTSSGALVGGAYALGQDPDMLEQSIEEFLNSPEFQSSVINAIEEAHKHTDKKLADKIQNYLKSKILMFQALFRPGILSAKEFQFMIDHLIPDIDIEDTKIPFRAVATDLVTGKPVVFSQGSLREAIMASSAVPGAIEPFRKGGWLLADGGILAHVPVTITRREGADRVIAVAITKNIHLDNDLKTAQDIFNRANDITTYYLVDHELKEADVVIRPDVGSLHWSEFSRARHLIEEGERAARARVDQIKCILPGHKKWLNPAHYLRLYRLRKSRAAAIIAAE